MVEFTLVLPILAFIFLGVYDMSRVFTAQIAIESAAREAADFGAFNSSRWLDENQVGTREAMIERACIASSSLDGYVGDRTSCTNPSVVISLVPHGGSVDTCDQADRAQGPCWVQVDLSYEFDLIVPFGLDIAGSRLGLPDKLTFTRTSIFAISDFSVDQP